MSSSWAMRHGRSENRRGRIYECLRKVDCLKGTVCDGGGSGYVVCWSVGLGMCRTGKMMRSVCSLHVEAVL